MDDEDILFNTAFQQTVELGNAMVETEAEPDPWDVADGLLAGAIQYWLYSRQPCGDPRCEDCEEVSTAELRSRELTRLVHEFAEQSDYFHSPHDTNVGRA